MEKKNVLLDSSVTELAPHKHRASKWVSTFLVSKEMRLTARNFSSHTSSLFTRCWGKRLVCLRAPTGRSWGWVGLTDGSGGGMDDS